MSRQKVYYIYDNDVDSALMIHQDFCFHCKAKPYSSDGNLPKGWYGPFFTVEETEIAAGFLRQCKAARNRFFWIKACHYCCKSEFKNRVFIHR